MGQESKGLSDFIYHGKQTFLACSGIKKYITLKEVYNVLNYVYSGFFIFADVPHSSQFVFMLDAMCLTKQNNFKFGISFEQFRYDM